MPKRARARRGGCCAISRHGSTRTASSIPGHSDCEGRAVTREPVKVAIIGGGIGGLTAGIALRRAGFEPVIYERAEEFGEVGAGISLSPNAVKGLEALG
ncbi:MAG: NAD(P)-binding protein, partial [Parvibaculum sp.]